MIQQPPLKTYTISDSDTRYVIQLLSVSADDEITAKLINSYSITSERARLVEWMIGNGLSQSSAAAILGCSRRSIIRYLDGSRKIPSTVLQKLKEMTT